MDLFWLNTEKICSLKTISQRAQTELSGNWFSVVVNNCLGNLIRSSTLNAIFILEITSAGKTWMRLKISRTLAARLNMLLNWTENNFVNNNLINSVKAKCHTLFDAKEFLILISGQIYMWETHSKIVKYPYQKQEILSGAN